MSFNSFDIKQRGNLGEDAAERILISEGYKILARNYHSGRGEIDIIAQKGDELIFAEVKTRQKDGIQSPAQAVTPSKRKKLITAAKRYMYEKNPDLFPRFDVIEIYLDQNGNLSGEYDHIENAFWEE